MAKAQCLSHKHPACAILVPKLTKESDELSLIPTLYFDVVAPLGSCDPHNPLCIVAPQCELYTRCINEHARHSWQEAFTVTHVTCTDSTDGIRQTDWRLNSIYEEVSEIFGAEGEMEFPRQSNQKSTSAIQHIPVNTQQRSTSSGRPQQRSTSPGISHRRGSAPTREQQNPTFTMGSHERSTKLVGTEQRAISPSIYLERNISPLTSHQRSALPVRPNQRSTSPARSQQRSTFPARSHQRSTSPARHQLRSTSPARHQLRSTSPETPRQRSISPASTQQRSTYPARPQQISTSPARPQQKSIFPVRPHQRSTSPARPLQRSTSPTTSKQGSTSPARYRQRSPSPARYQQRSVSPVRTLKRSISPVRCQQKDISTTQSQQWSNSHIRSQQRSTSPVRSQSTSTIPARAQQKRTSPTVLRQNSANFVDDTISSTRKLPLAKPVNATLFHNSSGKRKMDTSCRTDRTKLDSGFGKPLNLGVSRRLTSSNSSIDSECSPQGPSNRTQYSTLADIPRAKRLIPEHNAKLDLKVRMRSPGRAEVERLFGQERKTAEALEAFQALEAGLLQSLSGKHPFRERKLTRRQSSPCLYPEESVPLRQELRMRRASLHPPPRTDMFDSSPMATGKWSQDHFPNHGRIQGSAEPEWMNRENILRPVEVQDKKEDTSGKNLDVAWKNWEFFLKSVELLSPSQKETVCSWRICSPTSSEGQDREFHTITTRSAEPFRSPQYQQSQKEEPWHQLAGKVADHSQHQQCKDNTGTFSYDQHQKQSRKPEESLSAQSSSNQMLKPNSEVPQYKPAGPLTCLTPDIHNKQYVGLYYCTESTENKISWRPVTSPTQGDISYNVVVSRPSSPQQSIWRDSQGLNTKPEEAGRSSQALHLKNGVSVRPQTPPHESVNRSSAELSMRSPDSSNSIQHNQLSNAFNKKDSQGPQPRIPRKTVSSGIEKDLPYTTGNQHIGKEKSEDKVYYGYNSDNDEFPVHVQSHVQIETYGDQYFSTSAKQNKVC